MAFHVNPSMDEKIGITIGSFIYLDDFAESPEYVQCSSMLQSLLSEICTFMDPDMWDEGVQSIGLENTWKDLFAALNVKANELDLLSFAYMVEWICLKIRMVYDPPINGAVKEILNQRLERLTFYMSIMSITK